MNGEGVKGFHDCLGRSSEVANVCWISLNTADYWPICSFLSVNSACSGQLLSDPRCVCFSLQCKGIEYLVLLCTFWGRGVWGSVVDCIVLSLFTINRLAYWSFSCYNNGWWDLIQVVYMSLVGSFPFNAFLSGILSCIGSAVLAGTFPIEQLSGFV